MTIKIKLPPHKELLLTLDQTVDYDTPFYRKSVAKLTTLPVAEVLGIAAEKIFLHLKKFVGEKVKKGDIIAEQKSFLSTKQYLSEVEGTLVEINHEKGTVVIETTAESTDIVNCFFNGVIAGISSEEISVKVGKFLEIKADNTANFLGGPVFYYTPKTTIVEEMIERKLIVAEKIPTYDIIKMEALGAKGFITLEGIKTATSLPKIKIKEQIDFKRVIDHKFPYCLIGDNPSTVFFYT